MTDILMRPVVRLQLKLAELREREDGQTTTEYAILLGFLAIAIIAQSVAVVAAIDATNQAARDAARAQSLGRSASAAARDALPGWVQLNNVSHGSCSDVCVQVEAGVPVGWPGFMTITHVPVTRDAVFVRHD